MCTCWIRTCLGLSGRRFSAQDGLASTHLRAAQVPGCMLQHGSFRHALHLLSLPSTHCSAGSPICPAVGLVDKPWNTAIAFLPPSSTSSSGGDGGGGGGSGDVAGAAGTRLLVGTGYHKVRAALGGLTALQCTRTLHRAMRVVHLPAALYFSWVSRCLPSTATAPTTVLLLAAGSLQVRLYDCVAGKRPQMELSWGEGRITALGMEPDGE